MTKRLYVLLALLLTLALVGGSRMIRADAQTTSVRVNVGAPLGTIPSTAVGLNASVYDGNLLDPDIPGLIRNAGVKIVRWPGGSMADVYHWQTNSITPGQGGYANPNNTFDNFMSVVQRAGAQAMVTVNYGSNASGTAGGDPQEAASWVNYANNVHHYGVQYWEIGNELYGNGTYGANWETDLHPDKGPVAYGQHANEFIKAMKAADPSIKVGVVLTAPGNWPDQEAGTNPPWNNNVIVTSCPYFDFAIVHWYPQDPGHESDANLLNSPEQGIPGRTDSIPTMVAHLRSEIAQYCPSRASQIGIMITETNSVSYNPGKQTVSVVNALFLADNYMTWLEHGVANVDWWQLHNGPVLGTNNSTDLYGNANYGDYGVLSNGQPPEPPADTPFPAYYGLQMLSMLAQPDGTMLEATSDNALVVAHAVRQANGDLAILLINKDRNASHNVTLSLAGYTAAPNPVVYSYGPGSTGITTTQEHGMPPTRSITVAPYSLTTIVLSPKKHQK